MIAHDWQSANQDLSHTITVYRRDAPEVAAAFSGLALAATKPGALAPKTKELIALAIGIAARCDRCVGFHTQGRDPPRRQSCRGARDDRRRDLHGHGGPSYVYGAAALDAFDQLSGA